MSEEKSCPLMMAAAIGGLMDKWQPYDLEWLLKEPCSFLRCSRDKCELWNDDHGCGLHGMPRLTPDSQH